MEEEQKDQLIPINVAAAMMGLSVETLRRYERRGLIKSVRATLLPNARRLFHKADIEALLGQR